MEANKTKKIFVGGVSPETSVDELRAYFSQFGKVEEAFMPMLMEQQTKRHRGFGFITFENEDVVDRGGNSINRLWPFFGPHLRPVFRSFFAL